MKVLHLSDIHIDFAYKPGSLGDCPQPLCCREGEPSESVSCTYLHDNHLLFAYRTWYCWCWFLVYLSYSNTCDITNISFRGDYRHCDIPFWTAQAFLQYAAQVDGDVSDKDI